jgi:hypothetical protein
VQFGIPWSSSPTVGSKPGDLKYADLSGPDGKQDGKIDNFDRTFLGNSFPRYEYSVNFNIGYGDFDLNILGQGVGQRNNYLSGTGAVPFNSSDFIASVLEIHKNYWRPDNQNADFPRSCLPGLVPTITCFHHNGSGVLLISVSRTLTWVTGYRRLLHNA